MATEIPIFKIFVIVGNKAARIYSFRVDKLSFFDVSVDKFIVWYQETRINMPREKVEKTMIARND